MWFENIKSAPKTKGPLTSSLILSALTVLVCSILWQGCVLAAAETEQLDPALILLHQASTENTPQAENAAGNKHIAAGDTTMVSSSSSDKPQATSAPSKAKASDGGDTQNSLKQNPDRQSTLKNLLLKTNAASVTKTSQSPNKQILSRLVEQISSVKLHPKPKESQTLQAPQSPPDDKREESTGDVNETAEPAQTELPPVRQNPQQQSKQTLSPQLVWRLEQIIKQSGKTDEPQLLADMLYQTGHYELASYFYQLALGRDSEAKPNDPDKAWLMMQKAVCLADSDPQQAIQIYKDLTSRYPASPWAELAKNHEILIDWLETQQPERLIEQCRQDLKQNND